MLCSMCGGWKEEVLDRDKRGNRNLVVIKLEVHRRSTVTLQEARDDGDLKLQVTTIHVLTSDA